jgi:hypothetical protein
VRLGPPLGRRCSIKLLLIFECPPGAERFAQAPLVFKRNYNRTKKNELERDKLCVKSQPLKRVPRYTRVRRGARVSYP